MTAHILGLGGDLEVGAGEGLEVAIFKQSLETNLFFKSNGEAVELCQSGNYGAIAAISIRCKE